MLLNSVTNIGSTRRSRRLRMTAGEMDDRGWTSPHIVARKDDDLKQVFFFNL